MLLLALTLALAFANGANDVSKGIATLVGSGVAEYRRAVLWGVLWTFAGGLCAAAASQGLVAAFSGKGLLAPPAAGAAFLTSVAAGALLWVLFASRTGLPVSTTHAIMGALCGAGVMSGGLGGVQWPAVAQTFALPLLASPLVSMAAILLLSPALRRALGGLRRYCVCLERGSGWRLRSVGAAAAAFAEAPPSVTVGASSACEASPAVLSQVDGMDALHWLAAGLTSFARGMNDTPKILAMGLGAASALGLAQPSQYLLVSGAMALGGAIGGFRVTETLASKVTRMSHDEGLSANLVTATLVVAASRVALPVSTTHVSSGAIIGLGLGRGGGAVRWKTVREMALAWVVTLPVSAAPAAGCFLALR